MSYLTDQIRFLRADGPGFPYSHSLLIESGGRAIIDTGAGETALGSIHPDRIDIVINSHYHRDHSGGNYLFPKAEKWIHELDAPPLSDQTARDRYTAFYRWEEIMGYPRVPMIGKSGSGIPAFVPQSFHRYLQDGEVLDFGAVQAVVLHLPGHTPGHCGFYFPKEKIVFAADIDLTPVGPWYGDETSSLPDFEASIDRLLSLDIDIYCCSHRKPIREGIKDRLLSYKNMIQEREDRLLSLLDQPTALPDMTGKMVIFKDYSHIYSTFWERIMIEKHLAQLQAKGLVAADDFGRIRQI